MWEVESMVARKFGHLRLIHILITLVQHLEVNYVLIAILVLLGSLGFFYITLDFSLDFCWTLLKREYSM